MDFKIKLSLIGWKLFAYFMRINIHFKYLFK